MKHAYMVCQLQVKETHEQLKLFLAENIRTVVETNLAFQHVYEIINECWSNSNNSDLVLSDNTIRAGLSLRLSGIPFVEQQAIQLVNDAFRIAQEPTAIAVKKIADWINLDNFQRAATSTLEESSVTNAAEHFKRTIKKYDSCVVLPKQTVLRLSEIDVSQKRLGVTPLGISHDLDSALHGGMGNGELLVFMAPPNRGKTSLLCYVGSSMANAGQVVLHLSLEIGTRKVASRYYQSFGVMKHEEPNNVFIESRPPQTVSSIEIRRLVDACTPTVLIVDYAMLMVPSIRHKDRRFDYGLIAQELRALAIEKELKVITAWQVNREGARMNTTDYTHLSESWEIAMHADVIIGINQSEDETTNGILRLKVNKQRESSARPTINLRANWDTMELIPIGGSS